MRSSREKPCIVVDLSHIHSPQFQLPSFGSAEARVIVDGLLNTLERGTAGVRSPVSASVDVARSWVSRPDIGTNKW